MPEQGWQRRQEGRCQGYVARVAWGQDYHRVMREMLERVLQPMGLTRQIQVDSGPWPEKELAVKAGLGWIGRNTLFYHWQAGSFVNLGVALLPFPADGGKNEIEKKPGSRCGQCRRCLEACPGGALTEEGLVVSRCLSAVSQRRGDITEAEARLLPPLLYGCDECQKVCPYNREQVKKMGDWGWIDVDEVLSLSNRQFKESWGKTAAGWRGAGVIRRNARLITISQNGQKNMVYWNKKDNGG
ncbi:MAG: epoxyqueuosine reductase [Bacillota bacterium]